jgi:hypothetical protein
MDPFVGCTGGKGCRCDRQHLMQPWKGEEAWAADWEPTEMGLGSPVASCLGALVGSLFLLQQVLVVLVEVTLAQRLSPVTKFD